MEEYKGILKIKNELGEFYTDSYVRWLEESLREVKSQLSSAIKNNIKEQPVDSRHYWNEYHDRIDDSGYSDDEYDR